MAEIDGMDADVFEAAVLAAIGTASAEVPLSRWAAVYAHVSDALTRSAETERFAAPSTAIGGPRPSEWTETDLDAVWGLVYGARTQAIAARVLAAHPPRGGAGFVELGAGWAPFAVAASSMGWGGPIHAVEIAPARAARAAALFRALGLASPEIHVADATRLDLNALGSRGAFAGIAIPFALGEMVREGGATRAAALLRHWSEWLAPGGRLYVLEPGTRWQSRQLQMARDQLMGQVPIVAPCCGAPACPLLRDARDWCHFTWRTPLGRVGRAIADLAQRRWQEVHFSWLVLGEAEAARDASVARALEIRRSGPGKVAARICGGEGDATITALRKNAEAFRVIEDLEPGALVRIDRARLEARGDGLRAGAGAVTLEAEL